MLMVIVWWAVDARKWFKGPKVGLDLARILHRIGGPIPFTSLILFAQVNIEHQMLGREGTIVEGKEANDHEGSSSDGTSHSDKRHFDDKRAAHFT